MSLTTALFTGLTGMDVSTKALDVIGNNITNVNTVGYKSNRALFETQLSSNLSEGSAPSANSGGTNPSQIGLGVQFAGVVRNFRNGAIQPTGNNTDLALEGSGLFILNQGGQTLYSRDGGFTLDSKHNLVNGGGGVVQGYGIDSNFNITPVLQDINIPLGNLPVAEATRNVSFAGNLNAAGTTATLGSITQSQALLDLSNAAAPATAATLLTDVSTDGVTPTFATGEVITIQGAEKGGKSLGKFTFEVGAANTTGSDANGTDVQSFLNFLRDTTGLDTSVDGAGVTIDPAGLINITGNFGTANDIKLQTANITTNGSPSQPFIFSKTQDATGESVRTTFVAFDSLGTPLTVDLTAVLTNKSATGTTWRFYAESADDTDVALNLGNGTMSFDTFGQLSGVTNSNLSIDRKNTGAVDPLTVNLNFNKNDFTALTATTSTLAAISQDGSATGQLQSFDIAEDGTITGSFTNGLTRTLGQVAVATFGNPNGLIDAGPNLFKAGANSGLAITVAPKTFGAGRVVSGAVELSNVDLSQEFVNMITVTTGFSASSRLITTSDQLIQQLLAIGR